MFFKRANWLSFSWNIFGVKLDKTADSYAEKDLIEVMWPWVWRHIFWVFGTSFNKSEHPKILALMRPKLGPKWKPKDLSSNGLHILTCAELMFNLKRLRRLNITLSPILKPREQSQGT